MSRLVMPLSSGPTPETLQRLADAGLDPARLPAHIAVIMDGNGRWAEQRGLPRVEGHRRGTQSVRATVEECCRLGIGQLTLYCLSVENWKRPQSELDFLMALLKEYLVAERGEIMDQNIRFTMIGRRSDLPPEVLSELDENIRMSRPNTGTVLCLAINYGGRSELVDAMRSLAAQAKQGTLDPENIDEDMIGNALYTAGMSAPDLLIRTAGLALSSGGGCLGSRQLAGSFLEPRRLAVGVGNLCGGYSVSFCGGDGDLPRTG